LTPLRKLPASNAMKVSVPIRIAFTLAVLAAALWAATNKRLYDIAVFNALVSMGLIAVMVLHLRLKPLWSDAAGVAAGAGTLALIDFKLLHYNFNAFGLLSFVGLASLVALAIRAAWSRGEESARMRLAFTFAFLSLGVDAAAVLFHALTSKLNPKVLDLYLYSFDASMRVQLSFLMGQAYATWRRFGDVGMFIYIGLPVALAMVTAGHLLHGRKGAIPAMAAFLVTAPVGVIFYNLFPALGPMYIFGPRFPWNPLTIGEAPLLHLEPILEAGYRNAMPSLHMAWVLLAWWFSRGLSVWERSIAMVFVVFTAFATLGSGEHYFIDLVVGFPFALFVYGLCAFPLGWTQGRKVALGLGLGLTLGWFAALRVGVKLFWLSPILPWLACLLTVAAVVILQQRLEQASATNGSREAAREPVAAISVS
jgi:PAP2 superfamily